MEAPKEYILVIERTPPPSVFQTCVSPNLSLLVRQSGSWSGVLYVYTTDRAGRGWLRHMFKRRSGMLCVLSLILYIIYFLVATMYILQCTLYMYDDQGCGSAFIFYGSGCSSQCGSGSSLTKFITNYFMKC